MSKKAKNQKSEAELLLLGALGFSIHERVPRIERAADDLGVSPNTFQKYMKALERRGEGIPTDPSTQQELCKLGDEALRLWHEIANLLDERAIRIAMTSHISSNYLPQIVGTVVGRVDNELSVVTLDARADKLCDLLLTGEADFAVGPAYFDDVLRQLTSKKDKDGKAEKRP